MDSVDVQSNCRRAVGDKEGVARAIDKLREIASHYRAGEPLPAELTAWPLYRNCGEGPMQSDGSRHERLWCLVVAGVATLVGKCHLRHIPSR